MISILKLRYRMVFLRVTVDNLRIIRATFHYSLKIYLSDLAQNITLAIRTRPQRQSSGRFSNQSRGSTTSTVMSISSLHQMIADKIKDTWRPIFSCSCLLFSRIPVISDDGRQGSLGMTANSSNGRRL